MAVIFDTVRVGNGAIEAGDEQAVRRAWRSVSAMCSVLGVNPLEDPWHSRDRESEQAATALSALVEELLAARQQARADRDWAQADGIRDRLAGAGVQIEDRPTGPVWAVVSDGR